jgi:cytochrome c biogenesis protein CcmG/thiol:disulfide interchange protein DsbE
MLHRHSLLTALLFSLSCAPVAAPSRGAADLTHVPVLDTSGKTTNLAELAHGRVTVASLWAPWCEGCREEEPALLRLHQLSLARHDFVLVSIAIDAKAEEIASVQLPYPRLIDTGAFAEVGRRRVPTTFVIDASGRTVYEGGALDRAALDALTKALHREN